MSHKEMEISIQISNSVEIEVLMQFHFWQHLRHQLHHV